MIDSQSRTDARAEARFSAFATSHQAIMSDISDKLSCLSTIADAVAHFGQRIDALERQNVVLRREVDELRLASLRGRSEANESIVFGLPTSSSISPIDLINRVFKTLDASDMICHILNVRAFKKPKLVGPSSQLRDM